jgi:ABC-type transport system substrate-binding protein
MGDSTIDNSFETCDPYFNESSDPYAEEPQAPVHDNKGVPDGKQLSDKNTLAVSSQAQVGSLSPIGVKISFDLALSEHLFLPLYDIEIQNNDYVYVSRLAAGAPQFSDDHKSVSLQLRNDIVWSDGTPVVPDDVLLTFEVLRDPSMAHEKYSDAQKIDRIDVNPETNTLTFHFKEPMTPIRQMLIVTLRSPLPSHALTEIAPRDYEASGFFRNPIVNGPYQVKTFEMGQPLVFEKNPRYHNASSVSLETLVIYQTGEYASRLVDLESGTTQMMMSVKVQDVDRLKNKNAPFAFATLPYFLATYVPLNLVDSQDYALQKENAKKTYEQRKTEIENDNTLTPEQKTNALAAAKNLQFVNITQVKPHSILAFDDPTTSIDESVLLRQALAKAMDFETFIEHNFKDQDGNVYAKKGHGPITFGQCPSCNDEDSPYFAFDPAQARTELENLNWRDLNNDGILEYDIDGDGVYDKDIDLRLSLTYLYGSTSTYGGSLGIRLQANLREAGVELVLEPQEMNAMIQNILNKQFDLTFIGFDVDPNIDLSSNYYCGDEYAYNFSSVCDASLDGLIAWSLEESDPQNAQQLNEEIQKRIYESQVTLHPFTPALIYTQHENLICGSPDLYSPIYNLQNCYWVEPQTETQK